MTHRPGHDPVGGGWTYAAVILVVGLTLFGVIALLMGWI